MSEKPKCAHVYRDGSRCNQYHDTAFDYGHAFVPLPEEDAAIRRAPTPPPADFHGILAATGEGEAPTPEYQRGFQDGLIRGMQDQAYRDTGTVAALNDRILELEDALTERATLEAAARAVLAESSHDMPPSLGALDALRNALSETTNG